jgi:hypothetical protein
VRKASNIRADSVSVPSCANMLGLSLDAVWSEINQSDGGAELAGSGRDAGGRLAW